MQNEIKNMPLIWGYDATVKCIDKNGSTLTEEARIGLRHIENGRVYRLTGFVTKAGDVVDKAINTLGHKCTHAEFTLMQDEEV